MGFFDKKTKVTTTQQTTNVNASVQAQGPAILGDGNAISLTDHNAIQASLNFAGTAQQQALALASESQKGAAALTLGLIDRYTAASKDTLRGSIDQINKQSIEARDFALASVTSETGRITDKLLTYGGLGIVLLVGLVVMRS